MPRPDRGVIEAALHYTEAAGKQPTVLRSSRPSWKVARPAPRAWMATFMAKWSERFARVRAGHLHISLARKDGSSAFYAPTGSPYHVRGNALVSSGARQGADARAPRDGRRYPSTATRAWVPGYWATDQCHLGCRESHLRICG